MHEVLVNRLGGLSLPRKSVVRLTDRPDMTLDVYRGRKTTIQYTTINQGIRVLTDTVNRMSSAQEYIPKSDSLTIKGWSGGAMVLSKLPVPGSPTIWVIVGQGPIALAVGAGGDCLDIFTLLYHFSLLPPSIWETARYRLKYCLKEP